MMAEFERLLAKSWSSQGKVPESATLSGHLRDVRDCAIGVLERTSQEQLDALGLSVGSWKDRLFRIVEFAAATHDLGKANDHFQNLVRRQLRQRQGLRHEWVTFFVLTQPEWAEWSARTFMDQLDWYVAMWSITGHHPGYGRPSPPNAIDFAGTEMRLLLGHEDFHACASWISAVFDLGDPPLGTDTCVSLVSLESSNAISAIKRAFRRSVGVWDSLTNEERRFVAACKACLLASDVAGSALPKLSSMRVMRSQWMRATLGNVPSPEEIDAVVDERLEGNSVRPFQKNVSESPSRVTLVRAGCGTGKTLAAYLWAAKRCPEKRLYFCYPTTGTATEGFRDYLFNPDESSARHGARLFHSRAEVDLEMILHVPGDSEPSEEQWRVDALAAWSTPIACCTVDTVLGLVQNQRRGLFAWPALAQSAFVFDEIHAYDNALFGALLRFIDAMRGVPILLMTASLPKSHLEALRAILARNAEQLTEIAGPRELEAMPRYHRIHTQDPVRSARDELAAGGKVLWVSNTVGRALQVAEQTEDIQPIVYHSRFRYEDRLARHQAVIDSFKESGPVLAACTQVTEMSLDLSATLLITDLAPVPALVQRLGRLNRAARPAPVGMPCPSTCPFLVIEPTDGVGNRRPLPYSDEDLDRAISWLGMLGDGPLSQTDLAKAWSRIDSGQSPSPVASAWLDGGPCTPVDTVREGSPGLTVVMEGRDEVAVRSGQKSITQVALPMPPPPSTEDWENWTRIKGYPVAPAGAIIYDSTRGGLWARR